MGEEPRVSQETVDRDAEWALQGTASAAERDRLLGLPMTGRNWTMTRRKRG